MTTRSSTSPVVVLVPFPAVVVGSADGRHDVVVADGADESGVGGVAVVVDDVDDAVDEVETTGAELLIAPDP